MIKQAVVALIQDGEKILLGKRSPESRGQVGKWENLGGEVDEDETPEQAVVREIKEELGIDFTPGRIVIDDSFKNGEDNWHVIIYEGNFVGIPEAMIPAETSEVRWFDKSELKDVDLATYTREDFVRFGWIKE